MTINEICRWPYILIKMFNRSIQYNKHLLEIILVWLNNLTKFYHFTIPIKFSCTAAFCMQRVVEQIVQWRLFLFAVVFYLKSVKLFNFHSSKNSCWQNEWTFSDQKKTLPRNCLDVRSKKHMFRTKTSLRPNPTNTF